MINVSKVEDGKWCVFNRKNGKCADIVRINEYNPYAINNKPKYRVDFEGYTKESMIEHFQTAKGIAYKCIR